MKYLSSIFALVVIMTTSVMAQVKPNEITKYKAIGDVSLTLHVFYPPNHKKSNKTPAIVFFHGGGFNGGSPKAFYRQSAYLSSRGLVAISVEYRIKKKHGTSPIESVKDAMSAMRYIRAHALDFGINPNMLAAGGGSAGGHLATATATLTRFNETTDDMKISVRPNALVLFNPVYDTGPKGYGYERMRKRFGEKSKGYTDSQIKQFLQDFSPMHNLHADVPPSVVFLGTKDKLIPVSTAKKFQSKMQALGVRSDLHLYEGMPHAFFNKARYYETLLEADKFLTSLGYIKGKPTLKRQEQKPRKPSKAAKKRKDK